MPKRPPHRRELTDRYCRDTDEPMTWDTEHWALPAATAHRHQDIRRRVPSQRQAPLEHHRSFGDRLKEAREARIVRAKAALGADPQGEKMEARPWATVCRRSTSAT